MNNINIMNVNHLAMSDAMNLYNKVFKLQQFIAKQQHTLETSTCEDEKSRMVEYIEADNADLAELNTKLAPLLKKLGMI